MAVHDYHQGLDRYDPKAILQDGCGECDKRAASGLHGLCELDSSNLDLLWRRMLNERMSSEQTDEHQATYGGYYSFNDRQLGESLYLMAVLDQRGRLGAASFSPERFDVHSVRAAEGLAEDGAPL